MRPAVRLFGADGYVRRMLQVTHEDGAAGEAWTYLYNWPVTGLPQIASGKFLEN